MDSVLSSQVSAYSSAIIAFAVPLTIAALFVIVRAFELITLPDRVLERYREGYTRATVKFASRLGADFLTVAASLDIAAIFLILPLRYPNPGSSGLFLIMAGTHVYMLLAVLVLQVFLKRRSYFYGPQHERTVFVGVLTFILGLIILLTNLFTLAFLVGWVVR